MGYVFKVDGTVLEREEFLNHLKEICDGELDTDEELTDVITELFETGSRTIGDYVYQIEEVQS